ncbi:hypothetical protein BVG19_g2399 [[Candida] boidinii]|nr:hypothetical protein BVG19_g2399 [[Candida] boidinii]OWB53379.1 hypothetical protein B5S27_g4975 [[Candida] boidinii]OWB83963.1 hypothetical protein B5S33_g2599 [[Candida] boidinii]
MKYSKLNSNHRNDDDISAIEMGTMDHINDIEQDSTNLLSSYNNTTQPSSSSSRNTLSHIQDSNIAMDNSVDFNIDSDDDDLNDSTTLSRFAISNKQSTDETDDRLDNSNHNRNTILFNETLESNVNNNSTENGSNIDLENNLSNHNGASNSNNNNASDSTSSSSTTDNNAITNHHSIISPLTGNSTTFLNKVANTFNNLPFLPSRFRYSRLFHNGSSSSGDLNDSNNNSTQSNHGLHPADVIPIGWGNDAVFSNMAAKPTTNTTNERDQNTLPTYEEVASDPTPPYWESSITAGYEDEIFVAGLPVGNIVNLLWNMMVSVSFQFIGFVITYLLHTSHAAKQGSRAGLGITLITYGYQIIPKRFISKFSSPAEKFEPTDPNNSEHSFNDILKGSLDDYKSNLNGNGNSIISNGLNEDALSSRSITDSPIFAYGLVALGVFITLKALIDYYKARRMEYTILHPTGVATESEVVGV